MSGREKSLDLAEVTPTPLPEPDPMVGRTPVEIRDVCKELAFESAQLLRSMVKDAKSSDKERLKLAELAAKHGLGQKFVLELSNPQVLEIVGEVAAHHMDQQTYTAFRAELEARLTDSG